MCVFPAPNSARLARNFPLFRLIPGYLRLFTPDPVKIFLINLLAPNRNGERVRLPAGRQALARIGRRLPAGRQASPTAPCAYLHLLAATCAFFR
jgi:hypothetical protein